MAIHRDAFNQALSKTNRGGSTTRAYKPLAISLLIFTVYWLFLIMVQWNILERITVNMKFLNQGVFSMN